MIPGWTSEKLDRLVKKVRELWTPTTKDNGFWENLYCLNPGQHEVFTDLHLIEAGFDMTKNARKAISQHLGYYGRKINRKYTVRKFHGGVKVWRIE